jgi:hypothetical protein
VKFEAPDRGIFGYDSIDTPVEVGYGAADEGMGGTGTEVATFQEFGYELIELSDFRVLGYSCAGLPAQGFLHKAGRTHLDRGAIWLVGIFGALKVKAPLGASICAGRAFPSCGLIVRGPATIPRPVSTRA